MNITLIVVLAVVGFIIWEIITYKKYKKSESKNKKKIMSYIQSGLSLSDAIEKDILDLNNRMPSKLNQQTIHTVSQQLAALQSIMSVDNVIEIYSTFIHRYINRNKSKPHPNVRDEKVLYAVQSMDFDELNGYFRLKADKGDDFTNKYPARWEWIWCRLLNKKR